MNPNGTMTIALNGKVYWVEFQFDPTEFSRFNDKELSERIIVPAFFAILERVRDEEVLRVSQLSQQIDLLTRREREAADAAVAAERGTLQLYEKLYGAERRAYLAKLRKWSSDKLTHAEGALVERDLGDMEKLAAAIREGESNG